MASIFARICLFFSSYLPLWVILSVLFFESVRAISVAVLVLGVVGTLFSLLYLWSLTRRASYWERIVGVERRDDDVVGYIVTYVVPFLIVPSDGASKLIGLAIFLVVICILYVRTNMIYINPTLALLGYRVYQVTLEDTSAFPLLTRRQRLRPGRLKVVSMGSDVLYAEEDAAI